MDIQFFNLETKYRVREKKRIKDLIVYILKAHQKEAGALSFIITNEPEIVRINRTYLNHDYSTDVITFDYSEGNRIQGDVFVCIDTIRENAKMYREPMERELRRNFVHGLLHLLGYNDKTTREQLAMREKENEYLDWFEEREI